MSSSTAVDLVGILNVNKAAGWTSHDVVAKIRRLAGQKRVGHAGTLDPMATGVLPVLLGRATRLTDLAQSGRKSYHAVVSLGTSTTTDDAEGEILASAPVPALNDQAVEAVLRQFRGQILQTPPAYSAIKVNGQRAYALARRGQEVSLEARQVTVHELTAEVVDGTSLRLDITCGSGTYVRSLARDLAVALGTLGHMTELVRTRVGPFALADALGLPEIEARGVSSALQPASAVLPDAAAVAITFDEAERLRNGATVRTELPAVHAVWVYDPVHTLVCLGTSDGTLLRSRVLL